MSQEIYADPKTGMKLRKLTELKPTAAKEYQDAMLHRVEHFSQQRSSVFNNLTENTIVNALKMLLNAKVQVDKMLGENREKVQDILEKVLLFGL